MILTTHQVYIFCVISITTIELQSHLVDDSHNSSSSFIYCYKNLLVKLKQDLPEERPFLWANTVDKVRVVVELFAGV